MNRPVTMLLSLGLALGPTHGLRLADAGDGAAATTPTAALTIVPFAVPVAVPVAVVERPTFFYGVAASAPTTITTPQVPQAATLSTLPTSPAPASDDPQRAQAASLLQRRCAECHQGPSAQGGLMLFDADGRLLDKLPRQLIVEQATLDDGRRAAMPPAAREPLTVAEQALIRRWAVVPKRLSY